MKKLVLTAFTIGIVMALQPTATRNRIPTVARRRLRSYPPIPFRSSLACCSASFVACLALASGLS